MDATYVCYKSSYYWLYNYMYLFPDYSACLILTGLSAMLDKQKKDAADYILQAITASAVVSFFGGECKHNTLLFLFQFNHKNTSKIV